MRSLVCRPFVGNGLSFFVGSQELSGKSWVPLLGARAQECWGDCENFPHRHALTTVASQGVRTGSDSPPRQMAPRCQHGVECRPVQGPPLGS